MGARNHVLGQGTYGRQLANTIERSVVERDAGCRQHYCGSFLRGVDAPIYHRCGTYTGGFGNLGRTCCKQSESCVCRPIYYISR